MYFAFVALVQWLVTSKPSKNLCRGNG